MRLCAGSISGHSIAARLLAACAWVILISSTAVAQRFVENEFRAYNLRHAAPAAIEGSLREFLRERTGPDEQIDVVSDASGGRILVRASGSTQELAAQFVRAVDQPAREQAAPEIKGYPMGSLEAMSAQVAALRRRYADRQDIRIVGDERTGQVVVQAPPQTQHEVARLLEGQVADDAAAAGRWNPAGTPARSNRSRQQTRLENISWQQLVRGLRGVAGGTAALGTSLDGTRLEMKLPSASGVPAALQVDQRSGDVSILGDVPATNDWLKVVRALDSRPLAADQESRAVPLVNAQRSSVTRAIALLHGHGDRSATQARWGGDVVAQMFNQQPQAQQAGADRREPMQLAQAPGNVFQPAQGAQPGQPEDTGAGSFLGPVQVEFLEGLDMFIIRGSQQDVARVQAIIDQIEEISRLTEPAIEVVPLQQTNSVNMAELINELNTNVLSARTGDVSVTPLVKPNALLLIGRPEAVEYTKEKLIARLDVPVEPTFQFQVFRLENLPAVDAEQTIRNFFAEPEAEEPTGLRTRVRVLADFRSNSLLVSASPRDLAEVESLLSKIDVVDSASVSEVRVFKLRNALAEEVEEVLKTILRADEQQQQGQFQQQALQQGAGAATQPRSSPRAAMLTLQKLDAETKQLLESGILTDVRVDSDTRANSLVVTAPQGSMALIAELVRQLDELPTSEAKIKVFIIDNGDAASMVDMLNDLFEQQQQQQGGPAIQSAGGETTLVPLRFSVDVRTNAIIASGTASDLLVVEAILLKLDSEDVATRRSTVYRLQNVDAQTVADAITQFLTTERDILLAAGETPTLTPFEQIEREVVVVPEIVSNSLIISATDRYFSEIVRIIKQLDEQPPMVLIQVLIAEIVLDNTEQFGVELGIQDSLLFDRSVAIADTLVPGFNFNNTNLPLGNGASAASLATREQTAGQGITNFALNRQNSDLGYGGLVLSAGSESISVLIRALQETSRLDIISRPQIMALNNQEAFVQVGSLVPYIQSAQLTQFGTINNTILQEVGLILRVVPRITPEGLVVMAISASDSELNTSEGIAIATDQNGVPIVQPVIDIRTAQTVVNARDGQTIILGGLITKDRLDRERKVPYLGDVPVLGHLFRFDSVTEERRELLIILTPHVIRGQEDIDRLNTQEYGRMSWCLADALDVHGDIGLGGIPTQIDSRVIYPDLNPTGTGPDVTPMTTPDGSNVPTPTPAGPQPSNPPIPGASADSEKDERIGLAPPQNRMTSFFGRLWDRKKTRQPKPVATAQRTAPDRPAVSPVDYQSSGQPSGNAIQRLDTLPLQ